MLCGSGEVVVCHDERLERLAGLPWQVRQTPLWKLQRADVGSPLGFQPARIPTLEEVLATISERMVVNIELKCSELDDRGLSQSVVKLVQSIAAAERVLISSFNAICLWRGAGAGPNLPPGVLVGPAAPLLFSAKHRA